MERPSTIEQARDLLGIRRLQPGQERCIRRILDEGRDTFYIAPTGSGKSACYQIPGLVLKGRTLVISPLLALIQDQVDTLTRKGIPAAALSGRGVYAGRGWEKTSWQTALRDVPLIYTTPETLRHHNDFFLSLDLSLLAVDEAHCVSGWGWDFRPSYREIGLFVRELDALGRRPVAAAFTATADSRVVQETIELLDLDMAREDVELPDPGTAQEELRAAQAGREIRLFSSPSRRNAALVRFLRSRLGEKGVIFCATRDGMEAVKQLLLEHFDRRGLQLGCYYGGVSSERAMEVRNEILEKFREGRIRTLIATSAFGMGVNIPDIRYAVHYALPYSKADYIQQCGRVGRDGRGGQCVLMATRRDLQNTWHMLPDRPALTYSLAQSADIRRWHREGLLALGRHCLETARGGAKAKEDFAKTLRELEEAPIQEQAWLEEGRQFLLLNCSSDLHRRLRAGELSYYDSVLLDGVYSLWYNGCDPRKTSGFSLRELACFLTGNSNFVFHGSRSGGSAKQDRMAQALDRLAAQGLLPIRRSGGGRGVRYVFTGQANRARAFELQERAMAEGQLFRVEAAGVAPVRAAPGRGRAGERKNTEDFLLIRFHLLRRIAQMKHSQGPGTISSIVFSRIPHQGGGAQPEGLFHIHDFFRGCTTAANRRSKERFLYRAVSQVLTDLQANSWISGWQELEVQPGRQYARESAGVLVPWEDLCRPGQPPRPHGETAGLYIRGVRIFF